MEDLRSVSSAANGAKSQGPSTPEGKAKSARNAETHGIHAKAVVLRSESAEAYTALRDSFAQQFQPRTPLESELIDQLTAAAWRLRRFTSMETAALDHAITANAQQIDATYSNMDPETRAYFAFDQLAQANSTLGILSRAQAAHVRQFDRTLRHLRAIEKRRNEPTSSPAESGFCPAKGSCDGE